MSGTKWSETDLCKLETLYEAGKSMLTIAKMLGRTRNSINAQLIKSGIRTASRDSTYLTVSEFARRMGVPVNTVLRWADWKLIKIRRYKVSSVRHVTRIPWNDVWAFLANEQTWMAWNPDTIIDSDMRDYAYTKRSNQSWQWLSTEAVAERLRYSKYTVRNWVRLGQIPSILVLDHTYIDSRILDTFVAPSERVKGR